MSRTVMGMVLWAVLVLALIPGAVIGQTAGVAGVTGTELAAQLFRVPEADLAAQGGQPAQLPQGKQSSENRLTLAVVGDIMLSRTLDKVIQRDTWQTPFKSIPDSITTADLAFANLECPASFRGKPYPGKPADVTFRANPAALLGLKVAGFNVLSLANNHMNDYGPLALQDTIASLTALGMATCGAGSSNREARKPAILERRGIRLAFLAYAEPIWSVVEAKDGPPPQAGVAVIREEDIIADITDAAKIADGVLVSLHWGEEFQQAPRESDRALARRLIDAGALAILGHHPHVLQGAEWYRQGIILYSMGNFVFDMKDDATYDSAVALINIQKIPDGTPPYKQGTTSVIIESLSYEPVHIVRGTYGPGTLSDRDRKRIQNMITSRLTLLGTNSFIREDGLVEVVYSGSVFVRQHSIGP